MPYDTGSDNLIGRLTSILTGDRVSTADCTSRSLEEACEPLLPKDTPHRNASARSSSLSTQSRSALYRSISEQMLPTIMITNGENKPSISPSTCSPSDLASKNTMQSKISQASPSLSRPAVKHALSTSQLETRSKYHVPSVSAASLQHQLIEQTRPLSHRQYKLERYHCVPSADGPDHKIDLTQKESGILEVGSDRYTKPARTAPTRQPLKSCIRSKSKSTSTTPPGEPEDAATRPTQHTLRRVKTVDFDVRSKSLPTLSAFENSTSTCDAEVPSSRPQPVTPNAVETTVLSRAPLCPSFIGRTKSTPADPAITRTAVHVIAIAPSWNIADSAETGGQDPATPTMQIVHSKNGSYEVIWDDVPSEYDIGVRGRRSSSASHALESIDSPSSHGLERVNTKLTVWSGSWNRTSDRFKPTIVVYPDDDGYNPHYDCAVLDDEDLTILAPPNSHTTSATPSHPPTRPASAPSSRMTSLDETTFGNLTLEAYAPDDSHNKLLPADQSSTVPESKGQFGQQYRVGRRAKQPNGGHMLSNFDEADLRFRGHRDSVTIAHSRLLRSGAVSPELFARRDSVVMAKKRMHARNHATSSAKAIPRAESRDHDDFDSIADDADDTSSLVSLSTVKEHAAEALKAKSSVSILCSPQQEPTGRHIQIAD
ncbi:hypothetical protein ACN47E_000968 [Coniothyrium glycines]